MNPFRFFSIAAVFALLLPSCTMRRPGPFEEDLNRLDEVISRADEYVHIKEQKISTIENMLHSRGVSPIQQYHIYRELFKEYEAYQFDKAKDALDNQIRLAEEIGDRPLKDDATIGKAYKAYYHAINTQKTAAKKIATVMDEFHTYALEWTPEYIRTYVDGVLLFSYNPDNYPKGRNADTWPFNKAFQLKLNLAWGGDWGGMYGVDESCLPATYEIDYVRVFQKNI